jgi:hypothetical protein
MALYLHPLSLRARVCVFVAMAVGVCVRRCIARRAGTAHRVSLPVGPRGVRHQHRCRPRGQLDSDPGRLARSAGSAACDACLCRERERERGTQAHRAADRQCMRTGKGAIVSVCEHRYAGTDMLAAYRSQIRRLCGSLSLSNTHTLSRSLARSHTHTHSLSLSHILTHSL